MSGRRGEWEEWQPVRGKGGKINGWKRDTRRGQEEWARVSASGMVKGVHFKGERRKK